MRRRARAESSRRPSTRKKKKERERRSLPRHRYNRSSSILESDNREKSVAEKRGLVRTIEDWLLYIIRAVARHDRREEARSEAVKARQGVVSWKTRRKRRSAPWYRAHVPRGRRACHEHAAPHRAARTRAGSAARFRAGLVNVLATDLSIAARDRRAPIVSLSPGGNERRSKKPGRRNSIGSLRVGRRESCADNDSTDFFFVDIHDTYMWMVV